LAVVSFLAGCPLPIPHDRPLAPVLYGTVYATPSMKPLPEVVVSLTGGYKKETTVETRTDANGNYEIGIFERATFYVILPAPAEGFC